MVQIDDILKAIKLELGRSIIKHGDWSNYSFEDMLAATIKEWKEFIDAQDANDITGPHGVLVEGTQVAACMVKMLLQLAQREAATNAKEVA